MDNDTENTFFEAFTKGRKLGQHRVWLNQTKEQLDKLSENQTVTEDK